MIECRRESPWRWPMAMRRRPAAMGVILHNVVGLLHGAMAIYYAYIDRVPVVIFGVRSRRLRQTAVQHRLDPWSERPGQRRAGLHQVDYEPRSLDRYRPPSRGAIESRRANRLARCTSHSTRVCKNSPSTIPSRCRTGIGSRFRHRSAGSQRATATGRGVAKANGPSSSPAMWPGPNAFDLLVHLRRRSALASSTRTSGTTSPTAIRYA